MSWQSGTLNISGMSFEHEVVLIGYSGHGYVAADCLISNGYRIIGYCDREEKEANPQGLKFLGRETELSAALYRMSLFVGIGSNSIREKVMRAMRSRGSVRFADAHHRRAVISPSANIDPGTMVAPGVVINAGAVIGEGVICNTACVVEHECRIGNYAHVAPGAVLAGNVRVGDGSFIGAGSVVRQGIRIGSRVTVGAGAVIIKDIPDGATVVGNPGRIIKQL